MTTNTLDRVKQEVLSNRLRGDNLRAIAKSRNISLYRLAREIGVSYQSVCNWATGRTKPKEEMVLKLAVYFGLIGQEQTKIEDLKKQMAEIQDQINNMEVNQDSQTKDA